MAPVQCPDCPRACYDHKVFIVSEKELGLVAEQQRAYWLDQSAKKKAGSDSYDAAFKITGYRYVREAIARAVDATARRPVRVVDFGCGPGSAIRYLAGTFPDIGFNYLGFEPNADFAERARSVNVHFPFEIRAEDTEAALKLERPWGNEPVDLFLALGTLCYVLPSQTKALFASLRNAASRVIVRDYLGNFDGESETAAILYHHHFGMFAHPYRKYLTGFEITKTAPSIGGPFDGRSWGVIEATHIR